MAELDLTPYVSDSKAQALNPTFHCLSINIERMINIFTEKQKPNWIFLFPGASHSLIPFALDAQL